MNKIIYILTITLFYGCQLFGQPDTLEYYPKTWGDSIKQENQTLKDSINHVNELYGQIVNTLDSVTLMSDSAYWSNINSNYKVDIKSENSLFEAVIHIQDTILLRFLYVDFKANYFVKPNTNASFPLSSGNVNFEMWKQP